MNTWWRDTQRLCYCTQEFLLRERLIVGNVIDLSLCLIAVSAQQKALHYIGHIDKWEGIVPTSNDKTLATAQFVGDACKVQAISNPENGSWPNDRCREMIPDYQGLHQEIPPRLGNPIGVVPGCRENILGQQLAMLHAINGPGTHVNKPTGARC